MKKLLAVILTAALVISLLPTVIFAEKTNIPSMGEYEGLGYTNLDTVFKEDDQNLSEIGKGTAYLNENDFTLKGEYSVIDLGGWVAFDTEIKAFGYRIDGGEAVIVEEAYAVPEDAVVAAALGLKCDYCARFRIRVDVSGLKGRHVIDYLVQLNDNNIYIISVMGLDLTITYEGPADPDAASTPEPEEKSDLVLPGIFFTFDEEDKYDGLFSAGHDMEDLGWDSEKKCEQIIVSMSTDPYLPVNAALVASDFFDDPIDLSKYKVLSIGVQLDENHGSGGQIYYVTDEYPDLGETQVTSINYKNHTDFQAINVNFAKVKKWAGELQMFRYDAFATTSNEESIISLYYIAFFETKADAENFAKAFAEQGYDVFPVVETPTPKPTNTPSPTPTVTPEASETEAPAVTETEVPTEVAATEEPKQSGCGSVMLSGFAVLALAGAAAMLVRRKKD